MTNTTTIIQFVPAFIEYQKNKCLAVNTLNTYNICIELFVKWLRNNNLENLTPRDLSINHVRAYKQYLEQSYQSQLGRSLTKSSINIYLIVVRLLLSYFAQTKIESISPDLVSLHRDTKSSGSRKTLTNNELKQLFSAPSATTLAGLRDRSMMELLFSAGLKISELTSLNRGDVDMATMTIRLGTRVVQLSKTASHWLSSYLKQRADSKPPLFLNIKNKTNNNSRLTARSIQMIIKKHAEDAGLLINITPETLRFTHGVGLLNHNYTDHKILHPHNHSLVYLESFYNPFK